MEDQHAKLPFLLSIFPPSGMSLRWLVPEKRLWDTNRDSVLITGKGLSYLSSSYISDRSFKSRGGVETNSFWLQLRLCLPFSKREVGAWHFLVKELCLGRGPSCSLQNRSSGVEWGWGTGRHRSPPPPKKICQHLSITAVLARWSFFLLL